MAAAFLASSAEAVEAMTIVLAAGVVRGWRSALIGTAVGLVTLAAIVALFGPAIAMIPSRYLQIAVGAALLLFGLRWLRKGILRSAGVIALHDESAIYTREARRERGSRVTGTAALARVGCVPALFRIETSDLLRDLDRIGPEIGLIERVRHSTGPTHRAVRRTVP
jgi:uncharacterized membrane protein